MPWHDTNIEVTLNPEPRHTHVETDDDAKQPKTTTTLLYADQTEEVTLTASPDQENATLTDPDTGQETEAEQTLELTQAEGPETAQWTVVSESEDYSHTYLYHAYLLSSEPWTLTAQPDHGSINLTWGTPTHPGDIRIVRYDLHYHKTSEDEDDKTTVTAWEIQDDTEAEDEPALTYFLHGLDDVEYTLWLEPFYAGYTAVEDLGPLSEKVTATPGGPPSFDDDAPTALNVDDNAPAGTKVGGPVKATDPNRDPLTYSLTGTTADPDGHQDFAIDNNGQIRLAKEDSLTAGETITITSPSFRFPEPTGRITGPGR